MQTHLSSLALSESIRASEVELSAAHEAVEAADLRAVAASQALLLALNGCEGPDDVAERCGVTWDAAAAMWRLACTITRDAVGRASSGADFEMRLSIGPLH